MNLEKLMMHISIILDYRQPWKVTHKLSDILLIARVVSCISPSKFHECFINWMRDCHSSEDGSAGKAL